jgi:hypothetical protein
MWSQGRVVDGGLTRQAVVRATRSPGDPCDAQPYLLRTARRFGEPAGHLCPVCQGENITYVTHVDDQAPHSHADQAELAAEPGNTAQDYEEFRVNVVEVCQGCSWNRLTARFLLGNGPPPVVSLP